MRFLVVVGGGVDEEDGREKPLHHLHLIVLQILSTDKYPCLDGRSSLNRFLFV